MSLECSTFKAVQRHILPLVALLYVFAYLDRVNLSFASLQMNKDLGYSASVYGLGAGVFFVGYSLFELPSNLMLARLGARLWIARIMLTWGLVASSMIFVKTPMSFYLLRFLLGAAEAGFFPGIILYLGYWFPLARRARAVALFMTATAFAGAVGAPISGTILSLDGVWHLSGWQWLFLIEGVPPIFLTFVVMRNLPNAPVEAAWLSPAEQNWLINHLEQESALDQDHQTHNMLQALLSVRVWLFCLIGFTMILGMYGFGFWVPQIIKEVFRLSDFRVALLTAFPYTAAGIGMVLIGMHSDQVGERREHVAASAMIAALGFTVSGAGYYPLVVLGGLCLAACGVWAMLGPFWALSTPAFTARTSPAGIAFISSVVNLGGFVGPYIIGMVRASGHGFRGGLFILAGTLFAGGTLALLVQALDKPANPNAYPKDASQESEGNA